MHKFLILLCAGFAALSAPLCYADEFSQAQKDEIGKIAAEYLQKHPEVFVKVLQQLENEQAQSENAQSQAEKADESTEVGRQTNFYRNDDATPMLGKASAKHYVIDFFDYNCGYCKVMEPFFDRARKEYGDDFQIIYVNIPVISKSSSVSATVAQAVYNLDRDLFFKFHAKLMKDQLDCNDLDSMKRGLKALGGDWEKIRAEISSMRPQKKIRKDLDRSAKLRISGTPYLIIDGNEVAGALESYSEFKQLLK
jgi:protein-disulfide isomerase